MLFCRLQDQHIRACQVFVETPVRWPCKASRPTMVVSYCHVPLPLPLPLLVPMGRTLCCQASTFPLPLARACPLTTSAPARQEHTRHGRVKPRSSSYHRCPGCVPPPSCGCAGPTHPPTCPCRVVSSRPSTPLLVGRSAVAAVVASLPHAVSPLQAAAGHAVVARA